MVVPDRNEKYLQPRYCSIKVIYPVVFRSLYIIVLFYTISFYVFILVCLRVRDSFLGISEIRM